MTTNTGGSAFPMPESRFPDGVLNQEAVYGMTLRDYFAAKAMQTMLGWDNDHTNWKTYAKDAYAMADEMMKARGL